MWNKLFKKKKSKSSSHVGEAGDRPRRTPACFSFGKQRGDRGDFYSKSGETADEFLCVNFSARPIRLTLCAMPTKYTKNRKEESILILETCSVDG